MLRFEGSRKVATKFRTQLVLGVPLQKALGRGLVSALILSILSAVYLNSSWAVAAGVSSGRPHRRYYWCSGLQGPAVVVECSVRVAGGVLGRRKPPVNVCSGTVKLASL